MVQSIGNIAAFSFVAAPALLRSYNEGSASASTVVKQWRSIYEAGKAQNPPIAAVTASAFLYLAWASRSGKNVAGPMAWEISTLYGTATFLTLGIIPFTLIFMRGNLNALVSKANMDAVSADKSGLEIQRLISKWIALNAIRSMLPLAGSVVGMIATFL